MLTEEDFSLDELVARMKKPEMGCIVAFWASSAETTK